MPKGTTSVSPSSSFTSFTCPPNTTDYKYDIKGTLDADNETGKKITVKSMATAAEVVKLAGSWGINVGDKSGAIGHRAGRRHASQRNAPKPW